MSQTPVTRNLSQPSEQSKQSEATRAESAERAAQAARAPGLLQRLFGVIVIPVRGFASLRTAPRWFGALAVSVVLVSASTFLFASTDIGARLTVERRLMFAEAAGHYVSAEQYATLIAREQRGAPLAAALAGAWLAVFTFFVAAGGHAIAHIAMAYASDPLEMLRELQPQLHPEPQAQPQLQPPSPSLERAQALAQALAAATVRLRFRHALSIAAHASLIMGLATPCRLLLNVWSGSAGPTTSIGVLLPFLPSDTVWAHLGNTIDLFSLWWAHTLATGFAIVYLRRPEGLRLVFIGIYLLAAVVQAATKAFVGAPSF
jgi:hypothetical protein